MKIRTDFVTNSSSSSFILGFKNKSSIKDEVDSNIKTEYKEYVSNDVMKNTATKEEAIKEYTDYVKESAWGEAFDQIKKSNHFGYRETFEWMEAHPSDVESLINKISEQKIKRFKSELDKYGAFSIVTYGDNDGSFFSELEHYEIPGAPFCIRVLSHH